MPPEANKDFYQASDYRPRSRRVDTPIDLNVNGTEKVPKETRMFQVNDVSGRVFISGSSAALHQLSQGLFVNGTFPRTMFLEQLQQT